MMANRFQAWLERPWSLGWRQIGGLQSACSDGTSRFGSLSCIELH